MLEIVDIVSNILHEDNKHICLELVYIIISLHWETDPGVLLILNNSTRKPT